MGTKNQGKSFLEDVGSHLGRPRSRKGGFESGSKFGPGKRRLLEKVRANFGAGLAECAVALELVLGRFKQDLA